MRQTPFKAKEWKPLKSGGMRIRKYSIIKANHSKTKKLHNGRTIWSAKEADRQVKMACQERDGNRCQMCTSSENLTASHFHGRSHYATRFEMENVDTLCVWCHEYVECLKQEGREYWNWKLNRMGASRFRELQALAGTTASVNEAIVRCMKSLGKQ